MNNFCLLSLLIGLSVNFTIGHQLINYSPDGLISTGTCSDQRINIVNHCIRSCQYVNFSSIAFCTKALISADTQNLQKWNVMVQYTNKTSAQPSYWFYNDCSIINDQILPNLKFTIWKATPSSSYSKWKSLQNQQKSNTPSSQQANEDCVAQRINGAYYAINYCQNDDSSLQVTCIKNNMMTRMGEKWDAVTYAQTELSIKYDYYNGCNITLNNYGRNNRNYIVWKAQ